MPQETELTPETCPRIQIWAAYNHMPGGQIVAVHFEDVVRVKKIGDNVQNLLFTAEEQMLAFAKSPKIVALNVNGVITNNKVMKFQGPDISYKKNAASLVIDWAKSQGLEPIASKNDKEPKGFDSGSRLDKVENEVSEIKKNILKILDAVGAKG